MVSRKQFSKEIQYLRGVAILAVIAFHAKESLTPNGYLGVDIFFLVSGYLIIPRANDALKTKSLKTFYMRRIRRLTPALIFMLNTMLPLVLIFGSWQSHKQFITQGLFTLIILGNVGSILVTGDYFNSSAFMPLVHTWSLSLEEQFYITLPLILMTKKNLLSMLSLASFLLFISQSLIGITNEPWTFYLIFTRFWEFNLGYILFNIKYSKATRSKGIIYLTSLVIFLFLPWNGPRIVSTLIVLALASLLILEGIQGGHLKMLGVIGNRAYSLYLFHMPILYLAKYSPLVMTQDRSFFSLLGLLFTVLAAEFCFRRIEYSFLTKKVFYEK